MQAHCEAGRPRTAVMHAAAAVMHAAVATAHAAAAMTRAVAVVTHAAVAVLHAAAAVMHAAVVAVISTAAALPRRMTAVFHASWRHIIPVVMLDDYLLQGGFLGLLRCSFRFLFLMRIHLVPGGPVSTACTPESDGANNSMVGITQSPATRVRHQHSITQSALHDQYHVISTIRLASRNQQTHDQHQHVFDINIAAA